MGRSSPLGIEGTAVSFCDRDEKGRLTVAQVRARDESGAWQCKRFAVTSWRRDGSPVLSDVARDWARDTRKSFVKGEAVARAATFQDFAEVLCENLTASGVGQGRIKLIKTVAAGLQRAGVTDMRTDVFPARVRSWITGLRAGWSFAEDAKNRRLTSPPLSPATRNKLLVIPRQVTGLAVKKRRLPFDPLSELPRFIEPLYIKPVFTIDELRRMVSDEARDRATRQESGRGYGTSTATPSLPLRGRLGPAEPRKTASRRLRLASRRRPSSRSAFAA